MRVERQALEIDATLRDRSRKVIERLRERRCVPIGIDEDERSPSVHGHGDEREPARVEARLPVCAGCLAEGAVEVVSPSVVRALHGLSATLAARHRVPAMAADVDERSKDAISTPHDEDRHVARVTDEEAAARCDLIGSAGVLPRSREDALPFERPHGVVRVPSRREGPALLDRLRKPGNPRECRARLHRRSSAHLPESD